MKRVECVDNILDNRYISTVFPRLAASGLGIDLFYEVKANLRLDQLQAMRAGGMTSIQPDIESLSTRVLQVMRKGVSAAQNIQLLRWCGEVGINVAWNLLGGFPREPMEEYDRQAAIIPLLVHLQPPASCGKFRGPTLESAVLSGLCELIERDAFLIAWMNRLAVPRVDYSSMAGIAARIRSHYARFGIEALVFDITTDVGVPVMMAMAVDRSGNGPAVVIGLGCHLNPAVALKKALMEVCQVRPSQSIKFAKTPPAERLKVYGDVKTLEDHASFAGNPANLHEFDFLWHSGRSRRIEEMPDGAAGDEKADLTHVVGRLRAADCRVAYVDLTTPDVAPYGVHVVRTIATGLQPIHFGTGEERLGGRRLVEAHLNPCPHPLP